MIYNNFPFCKKCVIIQHAKRVILLNLISSSCKLDVYMGIQSYLSTIITEEEIHGYETNYSLLMEYASYIYKSYIYNSPKKEIKQKEKTGILLQTENPYLIEKRSNFITSIFHAGYLISQQNNRIEELGEGILGYLDLSQVEGYAQFYPFINEIENLICEEASLLYNASIINLIVSSQMNNNSKEESEMVIKNAIYLKTQKLLLEQTEIILESSIKKTRFLDILYGKRKHDFECALEYISALKQILKSYFIEGTSNAKLIRKIAEIKMKDHIKDYKIKRSLHQCYVVTLNAILGHLEYFFHDNEDVKEEKNVKQKKIWYTN